MKRHYSRRVKNPPILLEKKAILSILGIGLIVFSLLLSLSIFQSSGLLFSLKVYFYSLFGVALIFIPLFTILLSLPLLSIKFKLTKTNVYLGIFAAMLSALGLVASVSSYFSGVIGSTLWSTVATLLTPAGAFFVLLFALIASIVIATNTSPDAVIGAIVAVLKKIVQFLNSIKRKLFGASKSKFVTRSAISEKSSSLRNIDSKGQEAPLGLSQNVVVNPPGQTIWEYPPLSLLSDTRGTPANRGNLKQNASVIEKTLESFGITAKVEEVNLGPTITQYALKIPSGTKLSKIIALQNDLALALATPTGNVRIEAPIPGKSLVGIEIPNISPETVSLKSILVNDIMRSNKSKLTIGLGLDVSGNPLISDLSKMPHVLIAGTTGSGKSVLINALIATILFRASPQEVKLILVDPKRVELTEYNDIPHLLTPVIVETDKILSALKWAMAEMDRRYKMFHDAKVRNISNYNEIVAGFQALPYIVIVIDELQNLMEFAPVEVEDCVVRLAAMARATGIHLVLATQRPSVDIITGLIKANIPCRIAFNVSSMIDSRVILDTPGAEKLLGKGDMLYVPPDASKPMRIQGVYVSDTELRNLIGFIKKSGISPQYTEEVTQMPIGKMKAGVSGGPEDELFEEAIRTICQYDRASASLLQRRLRIGYARAARLLDELEDEGIIGPQDGSKQRDVLVKNPDEYFASRSKSAQNP